MRITMGDLGAPIGDAISYVRLTSQDGKPITVERVEYGKGYSWHGHADRHYRGQLYVVVDADGKLAVVNVIGLEDLLKGIVPAEIFATAPAEALKAQSITARSNIL